MKKDNTDYLSESHRHRSKVEKARFWSWIIGVMTLTMLGFMAMETARDMAISKEDKKTLGKIKGYRQQAYKIIRNSQTLQSYLRKLDKAQKEIESKYPTIAIWNITRWQGSKTVFFLVLSFPIFLLIAMNVYLRKKLFREWDKFSLKAPETEKPSDFLKLPEKPLSLWHGRYSPEIVNKYLLKEVDLRKIFAFCPFPEEEVRKEIDRMLKQEVKPLLKKFFPYEKHEEVLFCIELILYHHAACLYGNVPTSLAGKYIKDYPLKKLLALYQRNHVPVIVGVDKQLIESEIPAYILCKLFYFLDKTLSLRETISKKFNPIPFGI
ncbi:MAG: hypothetical protein QW733_01860 [Desulfurococcaceae archaeon]